MSENERELEHMLQGCRQNNRNSQQKLYEHFYGYAMSICLRYARGREEALEILNDSFLKVFNKIDQYDVSYPFKSWLRRILLNTAIDYHRKNDNLTLLEDMGAAMNLVAEDIPMPKLSPEEDVLPILQKLSPAYRMVFNLYVLEGYSHREIAEMLGIEVRSSRSNLVRAVQNLRALMLKRTDIAKLN